MTEAEARQVLIDVGERYIVRPLAPNEFTIRQFATLNGTSYNVARAVLDRALAAGEIVEVGTRKVGRHPSKAYARKG